MGPFRQPELLLDAMLRRIADIQRPIVRPRVASQGRIQLVLIEEVEAAAGARGPECEGKRGYLVWLKNNGGKRHLCARTVPYGAVGFGDL